MSRNTRISLAVFAALLLATAYVLFTGPANGPPGTPTAGGAGLVMLDADGNEVGPVMTLLVTDEAGHAESDQVVAVVAITLPDASGTPRSFLQRATHEGYADHYTQGFGIRFTGPQCSGTPYMSKDDRGLLGFPDLFVPSMTLTPPASRAVRVFVPAAEQAESVAVVSLLESNRCEPAGFTEDNLYRAEVLSADLAAVHPPPFKIRPR